jgi:DNA-binding MarR family transcriptional regulator
MTSVKGDSSARAAVSADAHVLELMGQVMQRFRDTLAAEDWGGLRGSHFRLLSSVPREGIRITDLAERLGMTKQASGQFVTFLVGTGHLAVRSDPDDGRVRVVVRTALGDSTIKAFNARVARMERAWAKGVGSERYADFREVLHHLGQTV